VAVMSFLGTTGRSVVDTDAPGIFRGGRRGQEAGDLVAGDGDVHVEIDMTPAGVGHGQVHPGTVESTDLTAKLGGGGAAGQIEIARGTAPSPQSLDPSTEAKLEASKMAAASAAGLNSASAVEKPAPSPSASLDAAAIASLEAQKRAMASAAATKSPAPGAATDGVKGVDDQSCSPVSSDVTACVSHLTKGSLSVVDVQLLRTGGNPLAIDVAASNGKDLSVPESGQLPSDATMLALAQAVATHF